MGLGIYFNRASDNEQVGYFCLDYALFDWVNTNIQEIINCENIYLDKRHLENLQWALENLNDFNCDDCYPFSKSFLTEHYEYDDGYWIGVKEVKDWVDKTLEHFDFDNDQLVFHAWW